MNCKNSNEELNNEEQFCEKCPVNDYDNYDEETDDRMITEKNRRSILAFGLVFILICILIAVIWHILVTNGFLY